MPHDHQLPELPPARRLSDGANAAHYDTSARGDIGRRDPIFQNLRKTDFQWALPDRAH
jgi:hypothetical protein